MGEAIEDSKRVNSQRRIIGLTGGIATGKSTVSDYLASQYNLPVLDADVYSRQAVEKGGEILGAITHRYGPSILNPDGTLNRPALGNIVFTNLGEKQWVEQQIHPYVRTQFSQVTAAYPPTQTLIYAIPLLFEANLTHLTTEIWVVACSPEQQCQRLMARNNLTLDQAHSRVDAQMPLSEKCTRADYVLDNSGFREQLYKQIDSLLLQHP